MISKVKMKKEIKIPDLIKINNSDHSIIAGRDIIINDNKEIIFILARS